ncbi:hypothetical protein F5X68DRAFT_45787 [Plectosphaerella plurivora]|uniref:Uncharacterized protein n=1 Tax=Plectosphaerella plurivora TaxID=936078 RepID=A0A9P8VIS2_9PEZI|nr:hypothetical protein F5X68DRAFT_45787 [Plectosphaerella plurivora]
MTNSPISLRTALTAAALLPVVIPAVYILHLKRTVSKQTTTTSGRRSSKHAADNALPATSSTPWTPISLPPEVKDDDSQWVLAHERVVSRPIAAAMLSPPPDSPATGASSPSQLLMRYAQATHVAFGKTPQAYAIKASISEPHLRQSFDEAVIRDLSFRPGDMVNGVYKTAYHGPGETPVSERVELVIEAPASYKGHVPKGLIVAEIIVLDGLEAPAKSDSSQEQLVVFVNETWMWRRNEDPTTLIEGAVGGWLHAVMAGWLILKGIAGVRQ